MTLDRRDFIRLSTTATAALATGACVDGAGAGGSGSTRGTDAAAGRGETAPAPRALRILILGGTGFIGPHQVRYARERGHTLTLFNRGVTAPDLFPGVEQLRGDRNDDLTALEGRSWDVVIDNPATDPDWVRRSAGLLHGAVEQYVYVSSLSAYSDMSEIGIDEDAPTHTFASAGVDPDTTDRLPYGLAKAESERVAVEIFGDRATIVRPGLIVGPGDPTDRFTYWPVRIDRGGEILSPGAPTDPTQMVDARDLAEFMVGCAEEGHTGPFNVNGRPRGMAELLYGIRAVTTEPASFTWVAADFLASQEVSPWSDMPCWVPPVGEMAGFARFDVSRALEHGLAYRPLATTARDTLDWHAGRPEEDRAELGSGLSPEREAEVLAAWHAAEA